jgi:rhodanese-related sulfurtransferase
MISSFKRLQYLVFVLIILGGILPLLWHAATLGGIATVMPKEAIVLLTHQDTVVLIDVRPSNEFDRQHVVGALSWPLTHIKALTSIHQIPPSLRDKTLLMICTSDFASAEAVRHLQAMGVKDVSKVWGGMQGWVAAIKDRSTGEPFTTLSGESASRAMSLFEQWSAVIAGFVFKPFYMALSLFLAIALWRTRAPDLTVLKWSMLAFFAGEAWCAVNYLIFDYTSHLSEFLHSFGMVVAFSFFIYAVMEGIDSRLMKLSAAGQRCGALELCGSCIKTEEVDCGARKIFLLLTLVACVLTFLPLHAEFSSVSYNNVILGTPYNYSHPILYQIFEKRYCPMCALMLLAIAFIILWRQPRRLPSPFAFVLSAAGLGALAFSFFRLILGMVFENNLIWSTFWEELTELMFITSIWTFLLLFRNSLLIEETNTFPWPFIRRTLHLPFPLRNLSPSPSGPIGTQRVTLIACEVLKDSLKQRMPPRLFEETIFLEYGLHRYPERLRQSIQSILDNLMRSNLVVLGYGLCGNGLKGISAGKHTLLVPRVDDCIPLLLGSYESYRRQMKVEPATFYLSKGWLKSGSSPLIEYQEYVNHYGQSRADMIIDRQYRHCRRLAFVADNQRDLDLYHEQAVEVANFCQRWNTRYEGILGSDAYIQKLMEVSQDLTKADNDFLIIPPGGMIQTHQFLRLL